MQVPHSRQEKNNLTCGFYSSFILMLELCASF